MSTADDTHGNDGAKNTPTAQQQPQSSPRAPQQAQTPVSADKRLKRRRTARMREMQLDQIAAMLNRGETIAVIAETLKIGVRQVSSDIAELRRRWRGDVEDYWLDRNRELASINKQMAELEDAWERSKRHKRTDTREEYTGAGYAKGKEGVFQRAEIDNNETGDPAIMAQIIKLRDQRIKLLGLYAPERVTPVNTDGTPFTIKLGIDEEGLANVIATLRRRLDSDSGRHNTDGNIGGEDQPAGLITEGSYRVVEGGGSAEGDGGTASGTLAQD